MRYLFLVSAAISFALTSLLLYVPDAFARNKTLPVPRFVSIKAPKANIRTGPNINYPIRWVFVRKWEPVEIIAEYEHWRKIRDFSGEGGWIHQSILSGRRHVIVQGNMQQVLYRNPKFSAYPIAKINPGVRAELEECEPSWCAIKTGSFEGWIERKYLWGVYPQEKTL